MTPRQRLSRAGLYKNRERGKCLGVFAGLGDYFGVSPTPFRIAGVIGLFTITVPTLIGYCMAAWILEDRPANMFESEDEASFWQSVRKEPRGTTRDLRHRFRGIEHRIRSIEAHVTSSEFELNREFKNLGE